MVVLRCGQRQLGTVASVGVGRPPEPWTHPLHDQQLAVRALLAAFVDCKGWSIRAQTRLAIAEVTCTGLRRFESWKIQALTHILANRPTSVLQDPGSGQTAHIVAQPSLHRRCRVVSFLRDSLCGCARSRGGHRQASPRLRSDPARRPSGDPLTSASSSGPPGAASACCLAVLAVDATAWRLAGPALDPVSSGER
jgi:hypothetical protein